MNDDSCVSFVLWSPPPPNPPRVGLHHGVEVPKTLSGDMRLALAQKRALGKSNVGCVSQGEDTLFQQSSC